MEKLRSHFSLEKPIELTETQDVYAWVSHGGSIKESRLFIGQKRELAEIYEAIHASASISIVNVIKKI